MIIKMEVKKIKQKFKHNIKSDIKEVDRKFLNYQGYGRYVSFIFNFKWDYEKCYDNNLIRLSKIN